MAKSTNKDMISEVAALKALEAKRKARAEACAKEVDAVMKKHNCVFVVRGQFVENQIETAIDILAK